MERCRRSECLRTVRDIKLVDLIAKLGYYTSRSRCLTCQNKILKVFVKHCRRSLTCYVGVCSVTQSFNISKVMYPVYTQYRSFRYSACWQIFTYVICYHLLCKIVPSDFLNIFDHVQLVKGSYNMLRILISQVTKVQYFFLNPNITPAIASSVRLTSGFHLLSRHIVYSYYQSVTGHLTYEALAL